MLICYLTMRSVKVLLQSRTFIEKEEFPDGINGFNDCLKPLTPSGSLTAIRRESRSRILVVTTTRKGGSMSSTVPHIPRPEFPRFPLPKGASDPQVVQACTDTLKSEGDAFQYLENPDAVKNALTSGTLKARIWALHQVHDFKVRCYIWDLEVARDWALTSPFYICMTDDQQAALNIVPSQGHTTFQQRKQLVDALLAVRNMVVDPSGKRGQRRGKGKSSAVV